LYKRDRYSFILEKYIRGREHKKPRSVGTVAVRLLGSGCGQKAEPKKDTIITKEEKTD